MTEEIKAIGSRIKELREIFNLSTEQLAKECGLTKPELLKYEEGSVDISVGILHTIAKRFGVELTTLLTGEEPHLHSYCLTRKDSGVTVNRRLDYKYKSLAYTFAGRKAEPFLVTVEPKPETELIHLNSHSGQEFNYMLSGSILFHLNGTDIILEEGDSIYFNSNIPHGMKALGGNKALFLATILD